MLYAILLLWSHFIVTYRLIFQNMFQNNRVLYAEVHDAKFLEYLSINLKQAFEKVNDVLNTHYHFHNLPYSFLSVTMLVQAGLELVDKDKSVLHVTVGKFRGGFRDRQRSGGNKNSLSAPISSDLAGSPSSQPQATQDGGEAKLEAVNPPVVEMGIQMQTQTQPAVEQEEEEVVDVVVVVVVVMVVVEIVIVIVVVIVAVIGIEAVVVLVT